VFFLIHILFKSEKYSEFRLVQPAHALVRSALVSSLVVAAWLVMMTWRGTAVGDGWIGICVGCVDGWLLSMKAFGI